MNKKSFTLLELVVVIIIIGALAALALPRLYKVVEYSRSVEALSNLKMFRQKMEGCLLLSQNNLESCKNSFDRFKPNHDPFVEELRNAPNSHFSYTISWAQYDVGTGHPYSYALCARRNTRDSGDGNSEIFLDVDIQNKNTYICGTNVFAALGEADASLCAH